MFVEINNQSTNFVYNLQFYGYITCMFKNQNMDEGHMIFRLFQLLVW